MKQVFISGSISIKTLPKAVLESIDNIEKQKFEILVGDAKGIDLMVQQRLMDEHYYNVMVCSIYDEPRNLLSTNFKTCQVECDESLKSERKRQTYKDSYMTRNSDYSFVIWDGKSKGSFANILRSIEQNQAVKIYLNNESRFLDKEEITEQKIGEIYKSNNGYTSTEILKLLSNENITSSIRSVKEFKNFLLQYHFVNKKGDQLIPNENYLDYFVIENYRGKINMRFKSKIINLIEKSSLF